MPEHACPACLTGNAADVSAAVGGLTAPFLCADCRYAAREATKHGHQFTIPHDRDQFLTFRNKVIKDA